MDNKDSKSQYNIDEVDNIIDGNLNSGQEDINDAPLYVIEDSDSVDSNSSENSSDNIVVDSEEKKEADTDSITVNESGEKAPEIKRGNANAFLLMFKILVSPVEGWKALKRQNWTPDILGSKLFYPLLALAAVVKYIMEYFFDGRDVTSSLTMAVGAFISYFFGYFLIQLLSGLIFPKHVSDAVKSDFGKVFVMMSISTSVLFYIIYVLLPMLTAVTFFLPLWTIYIITRGIRFIRVPRDKETATIVITCMLVIGVPIFCSGIFELLLIERGV